MVAARFHVFTPRKFMLRSGLVMLCLAISAAGTSAAAESFDRRGLADASHSRLDDFDFLSACLLAGGASDAGELAAGRSHCEELLRQLDFAAIRALPPTIRARELHAWLHSQVLIGNYQSDASDLRRTICSGDYNCLSAAAIYWDLCRRAGLELEIWSRPGHVYLALPTAGVTVEPGAKSWNGHAPLGASNRLAPPPRRITPEQLVGKFHYNRGLLLLRQGQHAPGLECIRASLRLDPGDREAKGNLLAGLNNWAAALCGQERFAEARALIEQGLAIDADYAPLVANARYVQSRAANE